MKVLTIVNSLGMGGVEKTLLACAPYLQLSGVELLICCYSRGGELEQDFKALGVKVVYIKKTASIFLDYLQVKRVLKEEKIDIVHSRFGFSSGGFVLACHFSKIPCIVSLHSTQPIYRSNPIIRAIMNGQLKIHKFISRRWASSIVGHSKANLDCNYSHWELSKKFRVIYNGIDFSVLDKFKTDNSPELRRRYRDGRVVLHIGSFSDAKNHEYMIKSFASLKPVENKLFLVLVGDGAKREPLKLLVKDLNIWSNVHFAGVDKELGKYFDIAEVFYFPSKYEGFGNAVIEAQYMGIPVCGSDIPPLRESIYSDFRKYCFDPNDVEDGSRKLQQLLLDNNQAGLLDDSKKNAGKYVHENFALGRMVNDLTELYNDLARKKNKCIWDVWY